MNELAAVAAPHLFVLQQKEMAEIFTDFETENRYNIQTPDGTTALTASESSGGLGGLLGRNLLASMRSFEMLIRDPLNNVVLRLSRPLRFFFHRLEIEDGTGRRLGAVQRRWGLLRRRFVIEDATGRELAEIEGPLWRPWTFRILKQGHEVGKISKRWSGMLKETFTDADTFGVELGPLLLGQERTLAFAATFLIDFLFFESAS